MSAVPEIVSLSLVSHTNAGKTTLARTLLGRDIGEVRDAPHVTEFVTVDVTPTMELLDRLRGMRQFQGVKVSPLLIVAKALLLAVRRNPSLNAVWGIMTHFGGSTHPQNPGPGDVFDEIGPIALPE